MAISLSKETRQALIDSLKCFFDEQFEQEIGDLKASLLLDFCLKEIGPIIYNRAVTDAQTYMRDKLADLDNSCFETEDGYWQR